MERTPTRTAVEKFTDEEGVARYGIFAWLDCILKSQKRHDSSRNERRRQESQKAERKKERFKSEDED